MCSDNQVAFTTLPTRNGDHGKVPPRVDLHEGDGGAGEEHGDEEEELAAPDVGEGADEGRREEGEETLDAHDQAVHQERVVGEGLK